MYKSRTPPTHPPTQLCWAVWSTYTTLCNLEDSLVTLNHFLDGEGKKGTKEEFQRAADLLGSMDFVNEGTVRSNTRLLPRMAWPL